MDRCNSCRKSGTELRRCLGCYKVCYCSAECQRKDWTTRHRKDCKGKKSKGPQQIPGKDNASDNAKNLAEPSASGSAAANGRPSGAGLYNQKNLAEPSASAANDGRSGSGLYNQENNAETKPCVVCRKTENVKACGRCTSVQYCSTVCQKAHWGEHKNNCKREVDGVIETDGFKERKSETAADERASRSAGGARLPSFFEHLFQTHPPRASPRHRPVASFSEAKQAAKRMFPIQRIVVDLDDVPGEFFGFRPPVANSVLLALITGFHSHVMRHGVYIKDEFGNETHVLFYLDNPFPFFGYHQLQPGNYICLHNPIIHRFLDGTVGIRIDDASDVKIMDI